MLDIALEWNCMKRDSDGMFDMALELNRMEKDMFHLVKRDVSNGIV